MEPGEEECHDKVVTSIMEVPQETCDLNPFKICAFVTKLVPRLEPVHECALVPQEVCQLKFMPAKVEEKPLLTKVRVCMCKLSRDGDTVSLGLYMFVKIFLQTYDSIKW